ncbi:MAG: rRNA maturation RNase YbeY [Bacteroidales bacterium]
MHSAISYYSENSTFRLKNKRLINAWITEVIRREGKFPKDISFIFCDDCYLSGLNETYLKHKNLTDIITFDYCEGKFISGEIYISIDRVKENAIKFKKTSDNELCRVMIHGILHLVGYSDKIRSNKLNMRAKEDECLLLLFQNIPRETY